MDNLPPHSADVIYQWRLGLSIGSPPGVTYDFVPQMYPVHGAAVAFFRGKFWVFGGSTGNDNYDHTITDKVSSIRFAMLMFISYFQGN